MYDGVLRGAMEIMEWAEPKGIKGISDCKDRRAIRYNSFSPGDLASYYLLLLRHYYLFLQGDTGEPGSPGDMGEKGEKVSNLKAGLFLLYLLQYSCLHFMLSQGFRGLPGRIGSSGLNGDKVRHESDDVIRPDLT